MLSRFLRRARAAWVRCPADCGAADPRHTYRDVSFADGQVSPDQARIALALPPLLTARTRLLHVGVGCSDLAVKFAARVERIDGITVLEDEHATALALGLPNYHVWTMNKHATALAGLAGPYELIVDNNPGSFACCERHFRFTLATYARLLAPGGRVVTDERGARWRQPGGLSVRWRRWAREGRAIGLVAERLTDTVWALRKPTAP
ncbi:MAG: hypothetical protein Q8P41_03235 [Pseudomonadota bacterium]|nr:hypothetical protein [Pseudomonadota bacterium]